MVLEGGPSPRTMSSTLSRISVMTFRRAAPLSSALIRGYVFVACVHQSGFIYGPVDLGVIWDVDSG